MAPFYKKVQKEKEDDICKSEHIVASAASGADGGILLVAREVGRSVVEGVECGGSDEGSSYAALLVSPSALRTPLCGGGDDCGGFGSPSDHRATQQDNG